MNVTSHSDYEHMLPGFREQYVVVIYSRFFILSWPRIVIVPLDEFQPSRRYAEVSQEDASRPPATLRAVLLVLILVLAGGAWWFTHLQTPAVFVESLATPTPAGAFASSPSPSAWVVDLAPDSYSFSGSSLSVSRQVWQDASRRFVLPIIGQ